MTYYEKLALVRWHFHAISSRPARGGVGVRERLAQRVIERLADASPAARRFVAGRERALARDLAGALAGVVHATEQFQEFERPLLSIGSKISSRGISPVHVFFFKRVMIEVLAESSPEFWGDEVADAWDGFLGCACAVLIRGAIRADVRQAA